MEYSSYIIKRKIEEKNIQWKKFDPEEEEEEEEERNQALNKSTK